jgi:hypothetical protein
MSTVTSPQSSWPSQDNASNTPTGGDIFTDLRRAIDANIDDTQLRARLLACVDDLRALQGQSGFAAQYQEFAAMSRGHAGLVGQYLAPLAAMIA